jgi:hypothetical protein
MLTEVMNDLVQVISEFDVDEKNHPVAQRMRNN